MRALKRLPLCLLMALTLVTGAWAAPLPDSFVAENLNGQQRIVKTYTLPAETDPEQLREPDFDYDGYHYSWAYATKEERPFLTAKETTQTVTVETPRNDLSVILAELSPTISYDDGEFAGELSLDHTTLHTEAAGYATRYNKITETKTIGPLDRNDMSYVPATTVKNGKTLTLANVEWQVLGTALVGESLTPSQYQAIATYSGSSGYQVATGYVTTAEYRGTITSSGIESITYTVVYTGTEIQPEVEAKTSNISLPAVSAGTVARGGLLLALGAVAVLCFLFRGNVYVYVPGENRRDYKLVKKYRVKADAPVIDLGNVKPYPSGPVAVEIKHPLAGRLLGKEFTVHCQAGSYSYTVQKEKPSDWHEFDTETLQEVTTA